jgi:hypothetical protein
MKYKPRRIFQFGISFPQIFPQGILEADMAKKKIKIKIRK